VRGFHAVLDPAAVGVGLMAYVLLTMKSHSPEAAEAFRARIVELDEVMECHKLTGEADLILKVATRDLASFNQLLSHRILAAPEVATARSSIILDEVKSTTALPIRV
jgi:DNA-binding Lrp family transcriptional regulator